MIRLMKRLFALLLTVLASTAAVRAQNSPATPEPEKSSAPETGLSKQERDRATDYLKQTQKDFLGAISGLSEAQWKFKPAPDRWSVAEVAEHIGVAEFSIWVLVRDKMMKAPATPEKAAEAKGKDEIILEKIPDRSRKAQAPEPLKPTGRWTTQAGLVKDFEDTRSEEIAYLSETKEDLRNHFEEHPALKTMDAYQWMLFNGAHCKRHTAQILEVKADPNFPKS